MSGGFFNLSTIDIQGQVALCCGVMGVGVGTVLGIRLYGSNIIGLYPLDTSSACTRSPSVHAHSQSPGVLAKTVSRHYPMFFGGAK